MQISDAHHFRKLVAGACMIGAPLLFLAASIVHPKVETGAAQQIAIVAAHQDRWLISTLLVMAGFVLLVPAILGLMHMLRERGVAFGNIGGAFALVGLVAAAAMSGFQLVVWQMVHGATSLAPMVSLYDRVTHDAATVIPLMIVPIALTIGVLVLAFGLWRAKAVTWWMAAFLAIAAILFAIPWTGGTSVVMAIVASAFLLVGLGSVGRMVLIETDEDWEHTPEYRGFGPAVGAH